MSRPAPAVPMPIFDERPACSGVDPELFFPDPSDELTKSEALAVCARCPVIRDCLKHALAWNLQGIWGGTNEKQRWAIRRRHGLTANQAFLHRPTTTPTATQEIR